MEPGEIIRKAREDRGWSQSDLAGRVGVSQVAVNKIESGETRHSKFFPKFSQVLDLDLADLDPSLKGLPNATEERPAPKVPAIGARRDFPVYASAEGGPGEIIRSLEPVDWQPRPIPVMHVRDAYGLYVVGTSMIPEYRPGDVAIVNPHLPIVGDEVYVFYAELDGEARATIKHLRREAPEEWHVSQHNPPARGKKEFTLSRKEWGWAHRVLGKYSRS